MPTPASAIQQASSIRAPSEAASSERPSTRPPVVRLDSLKNPQPRTIRFPRDGLKEIVPHCNNDLCAKSDMTNDGGKIICRTCGYVVEGLDLTSELTFGDGPGGLTQLWGTTISNNDDKARAAKGPRFMGGLDSRQVTERAGKCFPSLHR